MSNLRPNAFLSRASSMIARRGAPIAAAMTLCGMQLAAFAQDETLRPPKVENAPSAPKIMVYLVLVILVAAVVFAATLKTKRTHQD